MRVIATFFIVLAVGFLFGCTNITPVDTQSVTVSLLSESKSPFRDYDGTWIPINGSQLFANLSIINGQLTVNVYKVGSRPGL